MNLKKNRMLHFSRSRHERVKCTWLLNYDCIKDKIMFRERRNVYTNSMVKILLFGLPTLLICAFRFGTIPCHWIMSLFLGSLKCRIECFLILLNSGQQMHKRQWQVKTIQLRCCSSNLCKQLCCLSGNYLKYQKGKDDSTEYHRQQNTVVNHLLRKAFVIIYKYLKWECE